EAAKPTKVKRKLGEFTCTVCGGKKHNKQTCPVAKKQRHDNFVAQENQGAVGPNGPAAGSIGSTPPGPAARSHGSTHPNVPAAGSHGSPHPNGLAATSHGPPPTIIGSAVEGSLYQMKLISPNPNLHQSTQVLQTSTKVIRPKLKIRGKGATTQHTVPRGCHHRKVLLI
ncbi:putative fibrinogen alpha chain, partial [Sesbania bispinosa]